MDIPTKKQKGEAQKIQEERKLMTKKIEEIINFFNNLPGFSAYEEGEYTDYPGSIICVDINPGYPQENPDNNSWFRMYTGDYVKFFHVAGEQSITYSRWLEKVLTLEEKEKLTWKKFYECCLELSNIHTNIPKIK